MPLNRGVHSFPPSFSTEWILGQESHMGQAADILRHSFLSVPLWLNLWFGQSVSAQGAAFTRFLCPNYWDKGGGPLTTEYF